MAKVDTFSSLSTLFADTKLAGQTPGNAASPSPFQVALSTLRDWIAANWTGPTPLTAVTSKSLIANTSGNQALTGSKLVTHIIIIASASGTVNIGTTGGGSEIMAGLAYVNGAVTIQANEYFASGGTIYFSGHTHNLTAKIVHKTI